MRKSVEEVSENRELLNHQLCLSVHSILAVHTKLVTAASWNMPSAEKGFVSIAISMILAIYSFEMYQRIDEVRFYLIGLAMGLCRKSVSHINADSLGGFPAGTGMLKLGHSLGKECLTWPKSNSDAINNTRSSDIIHDCHVLHQIQIVCLQAQFGAQGNIPRRISIVMHPRYEM